MVKQAHTQHSSNISAACTCPASNQCVCPVVVPANLTSPTGVGLNRLLVVVNGPRPESVMRAHGGLPEQVRESLDAFGFDASIVQIDVHTAYLDGAPPLPDNAHHTYFAVILGGSKFDVTDNAPWMIAMSDWLRRHVGKLPILGICFGHQILGHALGGAVARNPRGWEQGTYTMQRHPKSFDLCDPLVNQLPRTLDVQLQHGQSVVQLPAGAMSFFHTPSEEHQFVRFATMAYGVQFHPEFNGPTMQTYLSVCGMSGVSRQAKYDSVERTEMATSIIPRFAELALAFRSRMTSGCCA